MTIQAGEIPSPKGTTVTLGTTNLTFRYVELQLPDMSVASIDMTDIGATKYYTQLFESLVKVGEMSAKAFLDGALLSSGMTTVLGLNQTITIAFPLRLGSAVTDNWVFWGALTNMTPNGMVLEDDSGVGVDLTFGISNLNASYAETAPAYTAATPTT